MTRLYVEDEGPGSHAEIVKYVETVLRDNFEPNDERKTWDDPYGRSARAITHSILSRLGIQYNPQGFEATCEYCRDSVWIHQEDSPDNRRRAYVCNACL